MEKNTPDKIVTRDAGATFYCHVCRKIYQKCKRKVYISADTLQRGGWRTRQGKSGMLRRGAVASVALSIALFASCSTETSDTGSDSWVCQWCSGVEIHQTATGCWFNFPSQDGVHYVTKNLGGMNGSPSGAVNASRNSVQNAAGPTQAISATFTISGAGKFTAAGGGTPQVRLYFQRKGDNMSAIGDYQYYRWWSVMSVPLSETSVDGTHTVTVPLAPKNWQSVYGVNGAKAVEKFDAAKDDMAVAGLTFGDQYGFGHGVWGSGKFTLTDWRIQ
jgi:hypothetical protein